MRVHITKVRREGFKLEELVTSMKLYRESEKCPFHLVNMGSLVTLRTIALVLAYGGCSPMGVAMGILNTRVKKMCHEMWLGNGDRMQITLCILCKKWEKSRKVVREGRRAKQKI